MIHIAKRGLEGNDGIFWMDFNDFIQYYGSLSSDHLLTLPKSKYIECRMNTKVEYHDRCHAC